MTSFESASTWKPPVPPPPSAARGRVLQSLAEEITGIGPWRLRVAIDGYTSAGKSTFSYELAAAMRRLGRPTLRASLDDFKKPWNTAHEKGYDRVSGPGYYRNAHDFDSARRLLLQPAGREGSGRVTMCSHDPLTGENHRDKVVQAPPTAVLLVDGVFAFRPEYNDFWEYRIWLQIDPELALQRGIERDTGLEGRMKRSDSTATVTTQPNRSTSRKWTPCRSPTPSWTTATSRRPISYGGRSPKPADYQTGSNRQRPDPKPGEDLRTPAEAATASGIKVEYTTDGAQYAFRFNNSIELDRHSQIPPGTCR